MTIFLDDLTTPVLSVAVDLAGTLELDSGRAWVGFTGATGGGYQNHDILSWEYSLLTDVTTTIGVADAQVIEGDSGVTNMVFTVTRDGDTSGTAIVSGIISDETATIADGDYGTLDSATVTFSAGQTTGTFVLPINGDQTPEDHESLTLNLTLDSGTATLIDAVAVGTILNDDTSIAISDATAMEAGSTWEFADSIALGGGISGWPWGVAKGTNGDLFISFSQINGGGGEEAGMEKIDGVTGEFDHDFVPIGTAGLFNAKEIEVHDGWIYVSNKGTNEVLRFDEATGVPDPAGAFISSGAAGLANPRGIVFDAAGNLIVSSKDTDQILKFSGADGTYLGVFAASVTDGGTGPKDLAVDAAGDVYVNGDDRIYKFSGVDGTPLGLFVQSGLVNSSALEFGPEGDLYVGNNGTSQVLQFNGTTGDLVASIDIDAVYGKPVGMAFDNAGTLYIGANLTTGKVLRYAPGSSAVFTVSLSSSSVNTVTVDYLTNNVTAISGNDYAGVSGTLVFEPGVTSRTIIVPTFDDSDIEGDETFTVTLSNAVGTTIADGTGIGTIVDDEIANVPPTVSAGVDQTVADGDNSGDQFVTLNGSASDSDGSSVSYAWTEGATALGSTAQRFANVECWDPYVDADRNGQRWGDRQRQRSDHRQSKSGTNRQRRFRSIGH